MRTTPSNNSPIQGKRRAERGERKREDTWKDAQEDINNAALKTEVSKSRKSCLEIEAFKKEVSKSRKSCLEIKNGKKNPLDLLKTSPMTSETVVETK